ncbi:MAG: hypothetical protein M0Z99_32080 [Betaproteobacteria bacterium]|nr:hypothetical protein [Betaproteobacteria bacterium]
MSDYYLQRISLLATDNGRMRFLIGEAITSMSQAEVFIGSREKMHPEGQRQWGELIDRLREVIESNATERESSALPVGRPKANKPAASTDSVAPITFPRANPDELEGFYISTKQCTMNCGRHSEDPRSEKERRFLCTDCLITQAQQS